MPRREALGYVPVLANCIVQQFTHFRPAAMSARETCLQCRPHFLQRLPLCRKCLSRNTKYSL